MNEFNEHKLGRLVEALENHISDQGKNRDPIKDFFNPTELDFLIIEILKTILTKFNLKRFEGTFLSNESIDIKSLQKFVSLATLAKPKNYELKFANGTRTIEPKGLIANITAFTREAKSKLKSQGKRSVLFSLDYGVGHSVDDLLLCVSANKRKPIDALVLNKILKLSNEDLLIIWGRMTSYFGDAGDRYAKLKIYPDLISKDYFETATSSKLIANRLTSLYSNIIPETKKRMIDDGYTTYPIVEPSLVRILCSPEANSIPLDLSNDDMLMAHSLSEALAYLKTYSDLLFVQIINAVGIEQNSDLVSSFIFNSKFESIKSVSVSQNDKLKNLLNSVKRAQFYFSNISARNSSTEVELLWRYKLGQEVLAPTRTKQIKTTKEISLQRELIKYFIDNGILAYGKSFGRKFMDMEPRTANTLIVEVKVFKETASKNAIEKSIIQLRDYLDSHFIARGVLVIYNCSNVFIESPREWFRGRIWILPINIGLETPSQKNKMLTFASVDNAIGFTISEKK